MVFHKTPPKTENSYFSSYTFHFNFQAVNQFAVSGDSPCKQQQFLRLSLARCCSHDGLYDGLGLLQGNTAMDDVFMIAVFTVQTTIVGEAEK